MSWLIPKYVTAMTICAVIGSAIGLAGFNAIPEPVAGNSKASEPYHESVITTEIDFERHVAPLLGRLGCNAAACHGAFGGQGDLQLSLFGYSSRMDFQNISRYVDTDDPEYSMVLQKPSGMEDHEGGIKFEVDSAIYEAIDRWIENGAKWNEGSGRVRKLDIQPGEIVFGDFNEQDHKAAQQTITVIAEFMDGSREDVTEYCHFTSRDEGIAVVSAEGTVTPVRHGDTAVIVSYSNGFAAINTLVPFPAGTLSGKAGLSANNPIDACINAKLNKLNIAGSPQSVDAEFLRRLTIDTIGTLPSPAEIEAFCASDDPAKRERKIDELLVHPMHAALWATRMCDITKCDVEQMGESDIMQSRRAQMWHDWFRKRFASNTSYAEVVRGFLVATSRNQLDTADWIKQEETLIRQSRTSFENDYADREQLDMYWRRIGDDGKFPLKETAELTAAALTGVRLNCAQCHKHPFDRWTQNDYAAFTNIFSRVVYGSSSELNTAVFAELDRRRQAKQKGEEVASLPQLSEAFTSTTLGRPISGAEKGAVVAPRAFDSPPFDTAGDLRQQFFEWLVQKDNPWFARNFANRIWSVYFGVGIVDPVDDFSISNPPSHPRLLDELAAQFTESNFDVRQLEKQILMSDAYQRSSTPNDSNRNDRRNFARQYVRPLLAEVALDAINKVLGTVEDFGDDAPVNSLAIEVGANRLKSDADRKLKILGRSLRQSVCDCDRRTENDLRQFVFLINDASIYEKIKQGSIRDLLQLEDNELVNQLYLRMLARHPSQEEVAIAKKYFGENEDRTRAFDDFVWALLNSREFITNH